MVKESAKLKRQEIESVKKWRKQRQQSEFDKRDCSRAGIDWLLMKMVQNTQIKRRGLSCLLETDQEKTIFGGWKGKDQRNGRAEIQELKVRICWEERL
ncbi:hypothetical protein HAX54_019843 [Datura stramonium]|uniref:Uncharacterized protein n=1 Tax=Datura stramonium TaxID=4076 RepID=A0ABS8US75_DATST|nr:hypothetical protein [Datura stramonium]